MSTDFQTRVREAIEAAVSSGSTDFDGALETACGCNTAVLREAKSLLPHYRKMAGFEPKQPIELDRQVRSAVSRACGKAVDPTYDEWKPPFSIAPYRVHEVLGRGGMGVVYRGVHPTRPEEVAIKVLRRRLVLREQRRFKQEEALLRALHHPGIVGFLHCGEAVIRQGPERSLVDQRPYFVMPLVCGRLLMRHTEENGLEVLQRIALMARICDVVEYAHYRGVVHCDLKPDNILVDENGQPRILDFGIAQLVDVDSPSAGGAKPFEGTRAYASPEQLAGCYSELSPASDVYALGLTAHELLTGRLPALSNGPLVLDLRKIRMVGTPASLSDVDREFQYALKVILATALRRTRGERYASAGELGADLAEVHRIFSVSCPKRVDSTWLSELGLKPRTSLGVHSQLLCALYRKRIGRGIELGSCPATELPDGGRS